MRIEPDSPRPSPAAAFALGGRLPELLAGLGVSTWAIAWMLRTGDKTALYLGLGQALAWLHLLAVPHELGHALASRLCGAGIRSIRIGSGPRLAGARILGVPVELRLWLGGVSFVDAVVEDRRLFRLRHLGITLGGPATNLALAALAWYAGGRTLFPPAVGAGLAGWGAWQAFAVANLGLLLASLWPWTMFEQGEEYPTDGRQALAILRWSDEDVARALAEAADPRAGSPDARGGPETPGSGDD